jgi:acetolactate synthase-1/2/3 large subunit
MQDITGGELVARMLAAEGVDVVFGIIDGSYFGLYSALGRNGIRLVSPRHESSAVHMAASYARLTGRLGVCIASNGPGAANALPGVAVENGEGNRVLLVTSWRRAPIVQPDRGGTYQYFDQVGVTKPMTKWSGAAMSFDRVAEAMQRAFRVSHHGRPGVVHVTVPEDVLNGTFPCARPVLSPSQYRRTEPLEPSAALVREAATMLLEAERPMIHAGSGVVHADATSLLAELASALDAPVGSSWGGRAALDARSPHAIPILPPLIDEIRREADVVLALGTRFGETDWWGKKPYWGEPGAQRVIQVDSDDEILGLNKPVTLAVLADVRRFLAALLAEIGARRAANADARKQRLAEYGETVRQMREILGMMAGPRDAEPIRSPYVATVCREVFEDDAILVIDGGNTAVWTNLFYENRVPASVMTTFKFGMLGAGVGHALGAKVAHPERQVLAVIGDGAMGMHVQEIETAVRHRLPVTYVVLCDRQWGMVKYSQSMAVDGAAMMAERTLPPEKLVGTDFAEIRFDRLAESMGAHGERVSNAADLEEALKRCLASGRCSVVHVDVDRVEHLWAPGLDVFKAMHQEPVG